MLMQNQGHQEEPETHTTQCSYCEEHVTHIRMRKGVAGGGQRGLQRLGPIWR